MDKNKNTPQRKRIRLKNFEYSNVGAYFVTICTEGRKCILSKVVCEEYIDEQINSTSTDEQTPVGEGSPLPTIYDTQLTPIGEIVDTYINKISEQYTSISVEEYVIMPNHIHLLLQINRCNDGRGDPSPTIVSVIGWLKYHTTVNINRLHGTSGQKFWQRSFYDHVIRNKKDYERLVKYIYENPINWFYDELYIQIR